MAWQTRVLPVITLVSPFGQTFLAQWSGNDRSKSKKLGVFEFPKIKGSLVQDLDISAPRYPLTIWFDGDTHDIQSEGFWRACDETGVWTVIHPAKGLLRLQLVSVTEAVQPIESGGMTTFTTEWMEPLEPGLMLIGAFIGAVASALSIAAGASSLLQFATYALTDTAAQVASLSESAENSVASVAKNLQNLGAGGSSAANLIVSSITSNLASDTIDTALLATDLQNLILLDAETSSPDKYSKFIADQALNVPDTATADNFPVIAVQELSIASAIIGYTTAVINHELKSRSEAVTFAENLVNEFNSTLDILDVTQELYKNNDIDLQYFSLTQAYSDLVKLVSTGAKFLLTSSYELATEKRFTLKKRRAPVEITITEYGTLGENDANLDLFISSNKLKNDEIRILQAGREVLVYA